MSGRGLVVAGATSLAVAGCGPQAVVVASGPEVTPYGGPLYVQVTEPDHPDVLERSGAAGRALECEGEPYLGSTGRNDGSGAEVYSAAEGALRALLADESWRLPPTGYRRELEAGGRVLFSYDVDRRTRIAVVVVDGAESHYDQGRTGWAVGTHAQCDPSELPREVAEAMGVEVWLDRSGRRVPTTEVTSSRGPEHCEWDDLTFLVLNGDEYLDEGRLGFVEDKRGEFAELEDQAAPYDPDAQLPADAVDTGFRREGRELWLAADESAAYLVGPDRTARWPASRSMFLCG